MTMRMMLAAAAALGLAGCNTFGCLGGVNNGSESGKCTLSTTFFASTAPSQHAPAADALETKS